MTPKGMTMRVASMRLYGHTFLRAQAVASLHSLRRRSSRRRGGPVGRGGAHAPRHAHALAGLQLRKVRHGEPKRLLLRNGVRWRVTRRSCATLTRRRASGGQAQRRLSTAAGEERTGMNH